MNGIFSRYKLADEEINTFVKLGTTREFDAGGVLFYEGSPSDVFFIIIEGLAKGGKFDGQKERVYHFFFPKMMVGEVSYLEGIDYPLTAVFVTRGKAIIIKREILENYQSPQQLFAKVFQKSIIGKVRYLQNSINRLASKDCKLKIAIFLLEHIEWLEHIQIKEIGSVLNITRESASRGIGFFVKSKILSKDGHKIKIIDINLLKEFVNSKECDKNHTELLD